MKTIKSIPILCSIICILMIQPQILQAQSNQPPSVNITGLSNSYTSGETVSINLNANDSDGTITQHKIFVNGTLVDTDGSNYTAHNITNIQNGDYTIKAVVTDNDGATAQDTESFTVGNSNTGGNCNAAYQESNGIVIIDAENLQISNAWQNRDDTSGFSGDGYIEWTGSDFFNTTGNGLITTTIKINDPGTYQFQSRTKVGEGSDPTEFNDLWLRFPDASDFYGLKDGDKIFPKGSGKTPNPNGSGANGYFKVYSTGTTNWTWTTKTSDNDAHDIYVDFDSPGVYTMQIAARSKHHLIDRVTLSKANANVTNLSLEETICEDENNNDDPEVSITGERRKWHNITLTFNGPNTSETNSNNPFLNYRLNVTFTSPSGNKYVVPGYYAADGNAANSNANSGNKWRAHLAPDEVGEWTWSASFRQGNNVAVNDNSTAGTATSFNGVNGTFNVAGSNKSGRDFRSKGRLEYVDEHYLRFAETGEYMIKQGPDSPENLFAYSDFDNTPNTGNRRKNFAAHVDDWNSGDPTWDGNKGRGLIGAVNYIASEGLNSMSFLTMNIQGDDENVFPYISDNQRTRIDVSKLAQWAIVIEHMQQKGIFAHFKTQETENETLLDNGNTGTQRKLYYRELIARFGYNLALNWNLGEENGGGPQSQNQSQAQERAMAKYFYDNDPYNHHVVIHKYPNAFPDYLLGNQSKLTGFSLQTNKADFSNVFARVKEGIDKSRNEGKKWAVACDEPGDAQYAIRQDNNPANSYTDGRKNALWGTLLAGGWGNEWYFGYQNNQSDLTLQDFRSRDDWWDYCRYAIQFFDLADLPLTQMRNNNGLSSASNDYCYAKQGEAYVVYLKNGGSTNLNLNGASGNFTVKWYDPRNGGNLQNGSVTTVSAGGNRSLGNAPNSPGKDWIILIKAGETAGGPPGYTFSTNESSTVNVSSPIDIAYGANGQFNYIYNTNENTDCNNDTFGDPIAGVAKKCYIRQSPIAGYTFAANENGSVNVSGTYDVAYGANGEYRFLSDLTQNIACNNNTFGEDPIQGVFKKCYIKVTASNLNSTCDFGTPRASGIPNLDTEYNHIYSVGSGGPNLSDIKKFSINWSATYNDLYQFALNTKSGNPSFYVDLTNSTSYQLKNGSPEITLTNTGIAGLNGSYWVNMTANSFILVSKSGGYSIHFSNALTAPNCSSSKSASNSFVAYPNPFKDNFNLKGLSNTTSHIEIYNLMGRKLLIIPMGSQKNEILVETNTLKKGMYIVKIVTKEGDSKSLQIIKK